MESDKPNILERVARFLDIVKKTEVNVFKFFVKYIVKNRNRRMNNK